MENVREVMAKVGDWKGVGGMLGVPPSKLLQISKPSSTVREKRLAVGDYWVNTAPDASWERLAVVLHQWGEKRAVAVTRQYLQQQGMSHSLLAEMSVYRICISIYSLACYHQVVLVQLMKYHNSTIPTILVQPSVDI